MPIVRIDIQADKSTAYKRAILNGVRDAVTSALGVPDERVMIRIIETPAENIDATDIKSDRLTIINVSMLVGRGVELKNALYSTIADRLSAQPGISRHDIVVVVNEGASECFYLGGHISCEPITRSTEEDAG